jgi:thymidylate synthase (FAD)
MIDRILELGHYAVLEHASFTFAVEGVSRVLTHQLVRHRLASFAQQSQRYVAFEEGFAYETPPAIAARPELQHRFDAAMRYAAEAYRELCRAGIAAEDARFVLPNAAHSRIIITMNARELRHFFRLRCCRRAQWEIRALAVKMLETVMAVAPSLFHQAGPGCLSGPCPEGPMSCGKAAEVRREFAKLSAPPSACPVTNLPDNGL